MGFFVSTALVSVTVSSPATGDSTLGASGGALAFGGFYRAHLFLAHRDVLALDTSDYMSLDAGALRAYWQGSVLLFLPGFVVYTFGQYSGVVPTGEVAVLGHLVGLGLGIGSAVGRVWM